MDDMNGIAYNGFGVFALTLIVSSIFFVKIYDPILSSEKWPKVFLYVYVRMYGPKAYDRLAKHYSDFSVLMSFLMQFNGCSLKLAKILSFIFFIRLMYNQNYDY